MKKTGVLLGLMMGIAIAGSANAAVILVGNPNNGVQAADLITLDTTWTANNTYTLQDQIYVQPGATLTIEAGTVIAPMLDASRACIARLKEVLPAALEIERGLGNDSTTLRTSS